MKDPELDLSELDEVLAQWKFIKAMEARIQKEREEDREELEKSFDDCQRALDYFFCNLNKNREV